VFLYTLKKLIRNGQIILNCVELIQWRVSLWKEVQYYKVSSYVGVLIRLHRYLLDIFAINLVTYSFSKLSSWLVVNLSN
jgi:hypothetical protein